MSNLLELFLQLPQLFIYFGWLKGLVILIIIVSIFLVLYFYAIPKHKESFYIVDTSDIDINSLQ